MPANNQRTASAQSPASPRNLAKYTNKDGSKFITVPKANPSDSSQPSTPTNAAKEAPEDGVTTTAPSAPQVNRKKQKRRQKAAAKAAALQEAANGHPNASSSSAYPPRASTDWEEVESDDEHEFVLAEETGRPPPNGYASPASRKKNKKKKKKGAGTEPPLAPDLPPQSQTGGVSRDKIWGTSGHEERERIKEFWLGLGEEERKSLVKVEKDAVLKKMKEQQKHTCSCTVCGRKRTAIEEELEGLYDAYYLELEQFANQGEGPPLLPSSGDYSMRLRPQEEEPYPLPHPPVGRLVEHVLDEDLAQLGDGPYTEDEGDDDEFSEDEERPAADDYHDHGAEVADFLTFGNSLQVKGGILTVADDLLKNDGKRFIEMMEQLAERRMAREEDAREHFRGYSHPNNSYSHHSHHHHLSPEEEEEEEDEEYGDEDEDDEDEYEDSQEDEYEDEEDPMTEEQRMEEGRRMFQIFAARMFEQRVLSAYKEKIAKERQEKLLEELEEESRQVDQQKARKAKNAQKKKDKAAQKKQAQAEEKARKEAEKAAEEAARLESEQKKITEQRNKAEEKRKQKEALKKAEEEARLKKEAERQRRLHEQREKQAETERKAREAKEREKKLREEQKLKEKELREQREREAQERKDKQEKDKREKEARAVKAAKEAQEAREAKEKLKEAKAAKVAAASSQPGPAKRGSQPVPVSLPTVLPQHPPSSANHLASPKIPVATPAPSKVPPVSARARQTSIHDLAQQNTSSSTSQAPSVHSQNPSPHPDAPSQTTSPGPFGQRKPSAGTLGSIPPPSHSVSPPGLPPGMSTMPGPPPMHMQPPPGLSHHQPPPGFPNRLPHEAMYPPAMRPGPNMMMPPPGMNGPGGRGFSPLPIPPPGFSSGGPDQFAIGQGFSVPKEVPPSTHQRQSSVGFDNNHPGSVPIARPTPIGRPGSGSQGFLRDQEDSTQHLGSRVLVDDDDEPIEPDFAPGSLRNQPPGPRAAFGSPFLENTFPIGGGHNPWASAGPATHNFPQPGFGNSAWGAPAAAQSFNVGSPASAMGPLRPAQSRHIGVRLMLCQACQALAGTSSADPEGFIDLSTVMSQVDTISNGDSSITEQYLLNLCDTEGSAVNGGGTFDVRRDANGPEKHAVRWIPEFSTHGHKAVGAPGEIGSPISGSASLGGI